MKLIICAAGDSKRMGDVTKDTPKPLLPLGNSSIIENLLTCLAHPPVNEIIILTGYLDGKFKDKIGDSFNNIKVSYVRNDLFSITNNMYSILLSKDKVDSDIIFVSGDVYVSKEVCDDFMNNGQPNSILIDKNQKLFIVEDDDPVKVTVIDGKIVAIDKKMPLLKTNGVAPGMYKLSYDAFKEFCYVTEYLMEKGNLNYGYIEPIKILIKKHTFVPHDLKDGKWCDIDTYGEYINFKKGLESFNNY